MPRTDLVLEKADGNSGYKTSEKGEQGLLLEGTRAIAARTALGGHERAACLNAKVTIVYGFGMSRNDRRACGLGVVTQMMYNLGSKYILDDADVVE
jgi:hypothetical protein